MPFQAQKHFPQEFQRHGRGCPACIVGRRKFHHVAAHDLTPPDDLQCCLQELKEGHAAGLRRSRSRKHRWVEHIEGFGKAWMTLLGVDMRDGDKLMSVKSVGYLLSFFTGIILLVVPVIALFCYNKIKDRKLRLLILSYWLMTLLIMVGYILGKLSSANWRLSPIVGMSAVVTYAFFKWAAGEVKWQRFISLLMIPVFMVSAITSFTILKMKPDETDNNHLYRIARGLESQGLSYGFATFWNANGATVAADSKVQIRNVTIEEGRCFPYRYQTLGKWYDAQPGQDKYFILMDANERDLLAGSELDDAKVGETTIEGYQVWIYTDVPPFN